jgi:hypothetical protein
MNSEGQWVAQIEGYSGMSKNEQREAVAELRNKAAAASKNRVHVWYREEADELIEEEPTCHPVPAGCWAFLPIMFRRMASPMKEIKPSVEGMISRRQFVAWYRQVYDDTMGVFRLVDYFSCSPLNEPEDTSRLAALMKIGERLCLYYEDKVDKGMIQWLPKVVRSSTRPTGHPNLTCVQGLRELLSNTERKELPF